MSEFDDLSGITEVLLELLKEKINLPETAYNLWFTDFKLQSLDGSSAVLFTPRPLKRDIISQKYMSYIKEALFEILGFEVDAQIVTDQNQSKFSIVSNYDQEKYNEPKKPYEIEDDDKKEVIIEQIINGKENESSSTTDKYTFDNFVVGSSNRFAKAACEAVAKEPCVYNPLFIYGRPGLGKTHLLYAVTHYIKKNHPGLKIVYTKCENFLNELIEALNKGTTSQFKDKYRTADVLLIDDIQFISGKESTQEEFFHTFSALYENDKQIILTSDRPPKEISPLEDRLRTRFEQGLIADINQPDLELRIAIIKNKSESMELDLPPHLMQYMAERLRDNVRQIEGVLQKLYAVVKFTGGAINKENIDKIISVVDPGNIPTEVIVEKSIKIVCDYYGVTEEDLKSNKRNSNISNARQAAIYILRKLTELSLKDIGNLFNRNHATVLSSINSVELRIKTKNNFNEEISSLLKKVQSNKLI